ncbi:MAG: sugar phosphate isomerase/epimerase [Anaerolineae bacterium]|nr:sugar phosphate isomerase/epimerase [Anaerolineae bacterium]
MKTRTGQFPIGFRRGGSDWQKDLSSALGWAQMSGLELIDLGRDGDTGAKTVTEAGLKVGSVDLAEWNSMISADRAKRADAIAKNAEYVKNCAAYGVRNFFLVMLPENPNLPRAENFGYMVESFGELAPVLEANNARLVIEGWPGPGALCCTPEGYRALFEQVPSRAMGINYDPSHLIRMGVDHRRFLSEFGERVYHVHGKDTELFSENLYEYGHEQPPTFGKPIPWGAMAWRYCIPGHGIASWIGIFGLLVANQYEGAVCIELEDVNFNGTEAGEKYGILQGARFLEGC